MRKDLMDLQVLELTELDSRVMLCDDSSPAFCCCCCCTCSCSCGGSCDEIEALA
jgi:hypothetical protein